MADMFAKFEAVWQAIWAYLYKVFEYFGYKEADAE